MRLIDADDLKKRADDSVAQYGNQYSTDMLNMFGLFKEIIDNAPTVNPCNNCDLYFIAKTKQEMRKGGAE